MTQTLSLQVQVWFRLMVHSLCATMGKFSLHTVHFALNFQEWQSILMMSMTRGWDSIYGKINESMKGSFSVIQLIKSRFSKLFHYRRQENLMNQSWKLSTNQFLKWAQEASISALLLELSIMTIVINVLSHNKANILNQTSAHNSWRFSSLMLASFEKIPH